MLEKDKNCIEFSMRSMMATHKPYQEDTEISITGMVPGKSLLSAKIPFDSPCDVVVVSKSYFEKLQADVNINAELAKQWEINYNLLLKKTGFDTVESLIFYLTNAANCDTLLEVLANLRDSAKYTSNEWKDMKKKLDECEKDYISERDKAEVLQTENEQLKKKLQVPDPFADYKEMLEKLYSKEDAEKFEWTLNHICGGQASANGWMVTAKLWRRNYETLSKLVGFSSTEEIQDYLTNEAECDTLQEAVSKLKDQVKYTCDEWHSANSNNNSWKAAAECNSPGELIEKREALEKEIGVYSRALKEWKEGTGCPSPSSAKTMIESQASWCHAYHEVKAANEKLADCIHQWQEVTGYDNLKDFLKWKANIEGIVEAWKSETGCKYPGEARVLLEKWKTLTKCETPEAAATWITSYESACGRGNRLAEMVEKLKEEVDSWKNVTGYSTPEDYMHARISGAFHTPFDYTAAWQKATGCNTPDEAKERIKALNERIDESEAIYNHLLMLTGFESEGEIEDALDKCDHSTLRKALVDYEFDYEALLKLTGYKSEQDIRVALNYSEQFVYETLRELINSLKRKAKFTESGWQVATGCNTPEEAEERLKYYKSRLGNAVQAASCAAKHLDNITF